MATAVAVAACLLSAGVDPARAQSPSTTDVATAADGSCTTAPADSFWRARPRRASKVTLDYAGESDRSGYRIPPSARIENDPASDGDRHVIIWDRDLSKSYELWNAKPQGGNAWHAGSGAVFDLRSNTLRPDGWTSADAAGLAVLPGLVRYDEAAAGRIDHAIRITVPRSDRSYLWPA